MEALCSIYWYPLYGFIRRQGHTPEEAQDLTQEFFARLLERELIRLANQERGRLRTFLLASLKNFLVSEWRKGQTLRRNAGSLVSLDADAAEDRYGGEPSDQLSPDALYDKRWAAALLDQVVCRLGDEYAVQGKRELFERLKTSVWGTAGAPPYDEMCSHLGMTKGALKVAVHRLRRRFVELLRTEVANTLTDPADVDGELRYLIQVMSE